MKPRCHLGTVDGSHSLRQIQWLLELAEPLAVGTPKVCHKMRYIPQSRTIQMMANDVLKMLKVVKKRAFQALDFGVPNFGNKPKWSFDISGLARISKDHITKRFIIPWWFQPIPWGLSENWGNCHDLEFAATTFGQNPIENSV